jgi:hypothetical protein
MMIIGALLFYGKNFIKLLLVVLVGLASAAYTFMYG